MAKIPYMDADVVQQFINAHEACSEARERYENMSSAQVIDTITDFISDGHHDLASGDLWFYAKHAYEDGLIDHETYAALDLITDVMDSVDVEDDDLGRLGCRIIWWLQDIMERKPA